MSSVPDTNHPVRTLSTTPLTMLFGRPSPPMRAGGAIPPRRRMLQALLLAVAGAVATAACGSSSTTSTGPSPAKCQVSLDVSPKSFVAGGTRGTVSVTTQPECAWTAASQTAWVSDLAPTTGQGTGQFTFQVPANPTPAARQGEIDVNGTRVSVSQEAAACGFVLTPPAQSVGAGGGAATAVAVAATSGCAWTAVSAVPWITVTSGATGSGNGSVGFTVAANTGAQRTGTLTIAGQTFTVTQAAVGCALTIAPTSQSIAAAGGAGSAITVTTTAACAWTAVSGVPWITVTSGAAGTGNGSVGFTVAANTGVERTGTLTIGSQTFTVTQAAALTTCTYTVNPLAQTFAATGGAGAPIAVATTAACTWTAVSADPWVTVTSGASGSGNGSVGFSVGANTGGTRAGTLTVAGQTFTVTQAAPVVACTYSINPTSQSIGAAGGPGTTAVTTAAGCAWTASINSNPQWLTLTSGASGTGNGTVSFASAPNTGAQRTASLTIAGQTFTVTQAAGAVTCTYSINPNAQSIGAAGGAGTTVTVTTQPSCAWGAIGGAPWIVVGSPSVPSGNGTVGFTVDVNTGAQRTGTVTIAGQTFTVTQAAGTAPCAYSISSNSQSVAAGGGNGSVNVTTTAPCAWTAVSGVPWITVTLGATGSGNGPVGFSVAATTGPERTGTLTIATRTFTVTQASGCVYTITPASRTVGSAAGSNNFTVATSEVACTWTAASNMPWLTVTTASGSGNGPVNFNFSANATGAQRTATVTIAGQGLQVTQTTTP